MVGIVNAHHAADFMNPVIGSKEQVFGNLDSSPVQILQRGDAVCRTKFPAKLVFADLKLFFQIV